MITFDLRCSNDHIFEGWFKDNNAFETQKKQKLIRCPICNDANIEKVITAVSIKKKRLDDKPPPEKTYKKIREFIETNFEDVGSRFAKEALRMHYGEIEKRNIRGTTTVEEEKMLKEEGVNFVKIALPRWNS